MKVTSKDNKVEKEAIVDQFFTLTYSESVKISIRELKENFDGYFGDNEDDPTFPEGPYTEEIVLEILNLMSYSGTPNPTEFLFEQGYFYGDDWELEIVECAS